MADEFIEDLTAREIQVLQELANGRSTSSIAQMLFISEHTVKQHLRHVNEKFGAQNRTHAVTIAFRRGLIQ